MIEKFELIGNWWLPSNPDNKIYGILTFDPDGDGQLTIYGVFDEDEDFRKEMRADAILGDTYNDKITLINCIETKRESTYSDSQESSRSSFLVEKIITGEHFVKPEDIEFYNLSVYFSRADAWANLINFKREESPEGDGIIKYSYPKEISARINDDCQIKISVATATSHSIFPKRISISQKTSFVIELEKNKTFNSYMESVNKIQNFLSFATDEPVYPSEIVGVTKIEDGIEQTVRIIYTIPRKIETPSSLLPQDMLFTFHDISDNFSEIITNWFEKYDFLEPLYNLYFGVIYYPHINLEFQFLSYVQALESYHRRKFPGTYQSPEEYERTTEKALISKLEEISNGISDSHMASLRSRIHYGNEYSLRKRLNETFNHYEDILSDIIEDEDKFINYVVDIRNNFVHEGKLPDEINIKEFVFLTQQLRAMTEIIVLSELGFKKDNILRLIHKNKRYQWNFFR